MQKTTPVQAAGNLPITGFKVLDKTLSTDLLLVHQRPSSLRGHIEKTATIVERTAIVSTRQAIMMIHLFRYM